MPFDLAAYGRWRAMFPWTDEQIAVQLETDAAASADDWPGSERRARLTKRAAAVRRGHVCKADMLQVMDALVKLCFCGKPALYRQGTVGLCRNHKHIKPEFVKARQARFAERSKETEKFWAARDAADKAHPTKPGGMHTIHVTRAVR